MPAKRLIGFRTQSSLCFRPREVRAAIYRALTRASSSAKSNSAGEPSCWGRHSDPPSAAHLRSVQKEECSMARHSLGACCDRFSRSTLKATPAPGDVRVQARFRLTLSVAAAAAMVLAAGAFGISGSDMIATTVGTGAPGLSGGGGTATSADGQLAVDSSRNDYFSSYTSLIDLPTTTAATPAISAPADVIVGETGDPDDPGFVDLTVRLSASSSDT